MEGCFCYGISFVFVVKKSTGFDKKAENMVFMFYIIRGLHKNKLY